MTSTHRIRQTEPHPAIPIGHARFLAYDGSTVAVTNQTIPLGLHLLVGALWFRQGEMRDDSGRYVYEQIADDPRPTTATMRAVAGKVF